MTEDALRDAAHDAFMAFWRGAESDRVLLWVAYLAAQERYDAYFVTRSSISAGAGTSKTRS
jgi:hypothetical protein